MTFKGRLRPTAAGRNRGRGVPLRQRLAILLLCLAATGGALAQDVEDAEGLELELSGISGAAAENVRNSLDSSWTSVRGLSSTRAQRRLRARAEEQARLALRPFGYYQAAVEAQLRELNPGQWVLSLEVAPGLPVRVASVQLDIEGPGGTLPEFADWLSEWPLQEGDVLNQVQWSEAKLAAQDIAGEHGFLDAVFTEQRIALDLEQNTAQLSLVLNSGLQARFGTVSFRQDFIDGAVLQSVPRFETGDPYRYWFIDQLRSDLWKLGYFEAIDVVERRVPGSNPVQVNLEVSLTPIHRVTHQGTIGYGTDTEFRTQYRFQRHQRSERGDNLAAGFAWQSRNQELALSAEYRLPRTTRTPQYWVLSPTYRDRDQTFEVDIEGRNDKFPLAEGRVSDFYLRSGRVKFLNREMTPEPIIQTLFVDYLYERNTISNILVTPSPGSDIPESVTGSNISHHLSLGVEWDWPNFQGQGFDITGHRERLWLFTANEAWGSDLDFTQLYGSSRWVIPMGDDWRLVARGELGYTDAPVQELELEDNGDILRVSLTELPFRYRFSAGGSQSVRGYDFEELSNNGIGSNHILTGSVEVERRIWNNWSAAVFVDVGNAFNDWDDMRLRKGLGFGVRWYTAGFPLRLDLAQAQDLDGKPWRLHLTIGSPLF